jgi:CheY-like chemotaxis protein
MSQRLATTVLVVDDDQEISETLDMLISGPECSVTSVCNGKEALAALEGGLRPCLVLLDLMMPVMNGWQFLEQVKSRPELRSLPIVIISAHPGPPGFQTLKKPFEVGELRQTVRHHCGGGRPVAS